MIIVRDGVSLLVSLLLFLRCSRCRLDQGVPALVSQSVVAAPDLTDLPVATTVPTAAGHTLAASTPAHPAPAALAAAAATAAAATAADATAPPLEIFFFLNDA